MRWIVLLALLTPFPVNAAQQPGRIDSARALADVCRPVERSLTHPARHQNVPLAGGMLCLGYMQAMQDISVLTDEKGQHVLGSCPPEQTTLGQLIDAFVTYTDAHRDQLAGSAAITVIKSLRSSFPCALSEGQPAKPSR
jgi:hypothetical protein